MNPSRQHTLSEQDYEVIRSFILPIQQNIPLADNPKQVTVVLLMLTCGMIEHTHFGTNEPTQDFTFDSDDSGYGLNLFQSVSEVQGVEAAALAYLRYLRTGRTDIVLDHEALTRHGKDEIIEKAPSKWRPESMLLRFSRWLTRILE